MSLGKISGNFLMKYVEIPKTYEGMIYDIDKPPCVAMPWNFIYIFWFYLFFFYNLKLDERIYNLLI